MKRVFTVITTLALSATMIFAASAESIYSDFSQAVENNDLKAAMEQFTLLEKQKATEADNANKSIEKAVKKNNATLYREAAYELQQINSYRITEEQSDKLLSLILNGDEATQVENAVWLYESSYTYSPTLTYQYGVNDDNFSMHYSSSISTTPGSEITLPSAENLKVDARRFGKLAGWGLTPDRIDYQCGETITMPLSDTTLYAQWTNAVTFIDEKSSTNVSFDGVQEGDVVNVPTPQRPDGAIFAGWFDSTNGQFIAPDESEYTVSGKGAAFEALWKNITIKEMGSGSYSPDKAPVNTQLPLTFSIANTGSEDVRNLTIKVTSESDQVTLMNTEAYSRGISEGRSVRLTGVKAVIDKDTPSGTKLPITVSITDEDENTYTSTFYLTVR